MALEGFVSSKTFASSPCSSEFLQVPSPPQFIQPSKVALQSLSPRDVELALGEKAASDFLFMAHMNKGQEKGPMFLCCLAFPGALFCAPRQKLCGMTATLQLCV